MMVIFPRLIVRLRSCLSGAVDEPKRNEGCVRVDLRRKSDGCPLYVICAHLSSGSKPEDERKRLKQIQVNRWRRWQNRH